MTTCPAHLGRGRESPGIFTARLLCLVAHIVGPLGPSRSSRFFLTLLNSYAFYTYPGPTSIGFYSSLRRLHEYQLHARFHLSTASSPSSQLPQNPRSLMHK